MRTRSRSMAAVLATILGMTVSAPRIAAAEIERAGKWQFSFPITFVAGESVDGKEGTSFDLSDDVGWGFGFAHHLDNHIVLGGEFTWLTANYDLVVPFDLGNNQTPDGEVAVGGELEASTFQFFGQYNFLTKTVTPFARAGFGWTWVDSNIPTGPAEGVCWWHPYYGYICDSWQPTLDDTEFSYGAGAGVRADVNEQFFIEGSYNILWLDLADDTLDVDGWRLNVGFSY